MDDSREDNIVDYSKNESYVNDSRKNSSGDNRLYDSMVKSSN